jgi:hypothetical protein
MSGNLERSFFEKHLAAILTSLISLTAVLVSAAQVWVAHINKQKELDIIWANNIKQQETFSQEKERNWKLDLAKFFMENESRIFSEDEAKRSKMRDIMIITFPSEFTSVVFAKLAKLENESRPGKEASPAVQAKIETWTQGTEKLDEVLTAEVTSIVANAGDLIEKFKGDERRIFSNKLAEQYQTSQEDVLSILMNSILPESDYWSYRVNIYVTRTLAKISNGWKGTKDQLEAVEQLRQTRNYKDATFIKNVDAAISNYKGGAI